MGWPSDHGGTGRPPAAQALGERPGPPAFRVLVCLSGVQRAVGKWRRPWVHLDVHSHRGLDQRRRTSPRSACTLPRATGDAWTVLRRCYVLKGVAIGAGERVDLSPEGARDPSVRWSESGEPESLGVPAALLSRRGAARSCVHGHPGAEPFRAWGRADNSAAGTGWTDQPVPNPTTRRGSGGISALARVVSRQWRGCVQGPAGPGCWEPRIVHEGDRRSAVLSVPFPG